MQYGLLFAVTLMTAVGNLGLVSVMPAIGRALAIPDALIACTFSLSALAWAVTAPRWARLSDRLGRKPLLLVGLAGFTASMLGCALVVVAGLRAAMAPLAIFAVFAVVRSTYGLFGSAAPTAAQALIADGTEGYARIQALSGLAGALSLGTIAGPAVASLFVFSDTTGLAGPPFAFAAAGILLMLLVLLAMPRDRATHGTAGPRPRGQLWLDRAMRPLLIDGFVVASAQAVNLYTLGFAVLDSVPTGGNSQWWIGLTMSLGAASSLAAQTSFVRLFKPSPWAMLGGGSAVVVAGNVLALVAGGLYPLIAGFVLAMFGYGLSRPGFAAAASLAVGPDRQSAVAGAVSSIAGASIAAPPVLAVGLYQFWHGAPLALAAAGAFWVAHSTRRNRRMFPASD